MRIRRCKLLYLEPRERVGFDLGNLLAGGDGTARTLEWFALAPHGPVEVQVPAHLRELLGRLSPEQWVDPAQLPGLSAPDLEWLLEQGLVVSDAEPHTPQRQRDEAIRADHWHPLSALAHGLTRWTDVDAVEAMRTSGTETAPKMRQVLGAPPPERVLRADAGPPLALPRAQPSGFDQLLRSRTTCRNFDRGRALGLDQLAQLLERVFAAHGSVQVAEDTVFLKKSSPSGGGLHPVECYLLARDVDGLAAGPYHYDPLEHALRALPPPQLPLEELLLRGLAAQHWFCDAHALAILAPRYGRNFWKYRNHCKAYRAVLLEAGHLSQTLYLAAAEAGLGAFVTCAINEACLDQALGLEPMREGVLAVCGFGWRAAEMTTAEFDPAGKVWQGTRAEG